MERLLNIYDISISTMVQYNQYVDPDTDENIQAICKGMKKKKNLRHYSKTDAVLMILKKESKKYKKQFAIKKGPKKK